MSAPHSPVPAYAAAVLGIALFSIMDMVMKGLTLAIGTFPTLLWRSLIGILLAAHSVPRHPQSLAARRTHCASTCCAGR